MTLAAGLYAGVLPLYLFFRVRAPALALGEGTAAIVALQDDLARRNDALDHAGSIVRHLVESRTRPAAGTVDTIRHFVTAGGARSGARAYATVPLPLRVALARAEDAMTRLGSALAEEVTLFERGRWDDVTRRVRPLGSLAQVVDQQMLAEGQLARRDLLARQQALQLAASEVLRDTILWLVLGALCVPVAVSLIRRRMWRPLADLEAGLARVADGDLTTAVAVPGSDDLVRSAMDLVSYRFGVDEIVVGGRLDPNLLPVQGDAIKLEQVIVNLLSNAIDALRGIKPPRQLAVDTWFEDGRVSVGVTDNG